MVGERLAQSPVEEVCRSLTKWPSMPQDCLCRPSGVLCSSCHLVSQLGYLASNLGIEFQNKRQVVQIWDGGDGVFGSITDRVRLEGEGGPASTEVRQWGVRCLGCSAGQAVQPPTRTGALF